MLTVSLERMKRLRGRRRRRWRGAGLGPAGQPGDPTRGGGGVVPRSPLEAEAGGQVGAVPVGDVGVVPQEAGDLLVRVQADGAGHHHGPVLVAAQLDVVRAPQQLRLHLARPAAAAAASAPSPPGLSRRSRPPRSAPSAPTPGPGWRRPAPARLTRRQAMTWRGAAVGPREGGFVGGGGAALLSWRGRKGKG